MFYAPPQHAAFYPDLINLIEDASHAPALASATAPPPLPEHAHSTVGLLFCKWDAMGLERLVGTGRARKMAGGEAASYMFC